MDLPNLYMEKWSVAWFCQSCTHLILSLCQTKKCLRSVVPLAMFSFFHTIQGDAKHDRDAGGFGWAPTQPSYPGSGLFHRNRWAEEPGSKGLRMYLSLVKVNCRSYIFSPISSLRAWIQCASLTRNLPRKILSLAETTKDNLPVSLGFRSPFDRAWHIQVHRHILNKITELPTCECH